MTNKGREHQADQNSSAIPPDPLIDEVRAIRVRLFERHGQDLRVLAEAANQAAREGKREGKGGGREPTIIVEPAAPTGRKRREE